jgi:glucose/arabinose dehydrogenase
VRDPPFLRGRFHAPQNASRAAARLGRRRFAAPAAAVDETVTTEKANIRVETFADGLSHPWGIAFLRTAARW